jgi:adenylate cyclase
MASGTTAVQPARIHERTARLIEWLTSDECHDLDASMALCRLGSLLRKAGVPVDLVAFHLRRLHPQILGSMMLWEPGKQVFMRHFERAPDLLRRLASSPILHVMTSRSWLALRTDDTRWTVPAEFRDRGLSELLIAPMAHGGVDAQVSAVTFGTRQPAGFSQSERHLLNSIMPSLRNAIELKLWRETATTLLDTYIGPDTGRRILSGHVERGDIETLEAALMFCDLRGFTDLSNRVSDQRILELLNTYFDQVVPAIIEHSGEILKFIGDGVLAIFQNSAAPGESCRAAFDAARAAQEHLRGIILPDAELRAGIALHYGHVSYGNIGSRDRLDFTVIGPDVNLTSRIEGMCDALGHSLLMSERFAKLLSGLVVIDVGSHPLKGFADPIQLVAWTER